MGLFGNPAIQRRHFTLNQHRTTIALEQGFWAAIEFHHGEAWRQWVSQTLTQVPEGVGRSAYLRLQTLVHFGQASRIGMDLEQAM